MRRGETMRREERDSVGTRSVYRLLVLIVMAIAAGRIATVTSREGNTAFLSANDRSRWCTVAALVEDGTYAIDRLIEIRDSRGRRPWQTIDKVRHRGRDGELHYYSSKPPLFPTLVAGLYAIVHVLTGMTLTDQPIYLTRILLALVNLPLLAVFLGSLLRVTHQLGDGDWSRRFLAAAVCFGTMLLPFTLALNNHLPAAASTALVVAIYVSAARRRHEAGSQQAWRPGGWVWFVAGLAAAFAAANELPALSMLALWVVLVFCLDRRGTAPLIAAAAVVVIAFFATNWIAHASLRPPYAHRGNGPAIAEFQPRENGSGKDPARPSRPPSPSSFASEDCSRAKVHSSYCRRAKITAGWSRRARIACSLCSGRMRAAAASRQRGCSRNGMTGTSTPAAIGSQAAAKASTGGSRHA